MTNNTNTVIKSASYKRLFKKPRAWFAAIDQLIRGYDGGGSVLRSVVRASIFALAGFGVFEITASYTAIPHFAAISIPFAVSIGVVSFIFGWIEAKKAMKEAEARKRKHAKLKAEIEEFAKRKEFDAIRKQNEKSLSDMSAEAILVMLLKRYVEKSVVKSPDGKYIRYADGRGKIEALIRRVYNVEAFNAKEIARVRETLNKASPGLGSLVFRDDGTWATTGYAEGRWDRFKRFASSGSLYVDHFFTFIDNFMNGFGYVLGGAAVVGALPVPPIGAALLAGAIILGVFYGVLTVALNHYNKTIVKKRNDTMNKEIAAFELKLDLLKQIEAVNDREFRKKKEFQTAHVEVVDYYARRQMSTIANRRKHADRAGRIVRAVLIGALLGFSVTFSIGMATNIPFMIPLTFIIMSVWIVYNVATTIRDIRKREIEENKLIQEVNVLESNLRAKWSAKQCPNNFNPIQQVDATTKPDMIRKTIAEYLSYLDRVAPDLPFDALPKQYRMMVLLQKVTGIECAGPNDQEFYQRLLGYLTKTDDGKALREDDKLIRDFYIRMTGDRRTELKADFNYKPQKTKAEKAASVFRKVMTWGSGISIPIWVLLLGIFTVTSTVAPPIFFAMLGVMLVLSITALIVMHVCEKQRKKDLTELRDHRDKLLMADRIVKCRKPAGPSSTVSITRELGGAERDPSPGQSVELDDLGPPTPLNRSTAPSANDSQMPSRAFFEVPASVVRNLPDPLQPASGAPSLD